MGHLGSGRNPLQFGHGFNLRNDLRVYGDTLPSVTDTASRRFWDVVIPNVWGPNSDQDTTDLDEVARRRNAGDAHLYADLQYGSASRCADIRGTITDPAVPSDTERWGADWFAYQANSAYSWLRSAPDVLARVPVLGRALAAPTLTPPPLSSPFAYSQLAAACEGRFRSLLEEHMMGARDLPHDYAAIRVLFDSALADPACDQATARSGPEGPTASAVRWEPNLVPSWECSFDVDDSSIPLDTAHYTAAQVVSDLIPAIQALPDYRAPDYNGDGVISAAEEARHAEEIAARYRGGLTALSFDPQFWYSGLASEGGDGGVNCASTNFAAGTCAQWQEPGQDSVALYRVDGLRDSAGLLPTIGPGEYATVMYRVPPLPSDESTCWLYNPASRLWDEDRRDGRYDGHVEDVIAAYADGQPVPGTEAPVAATEATLYEETWGFVDSRPAPVRLIERPTGAIVAHPATPTTRGTPRSASAYARMLQAQVDEQYEFALPYNPDGQPYEACGAPYARSGYGEFADGTPFTLEMEMCWMWPRGSIDHESIIGDLFESVSSADPHATSVHPSPLRFPIRRIYAPRHTDAMSLPDFGREDPESVVAHAGEINPLDVTAQGVDADVPYELSSCPYLGHNGMLRTSFTLQRYGALEPDGITRLLQRRYPVDVADLSAGYLFDTYTYLLFYGRHERDRFAHDEAIVFNGSYEPAGYRGAQQIRFMRPVYGPDLREDPVNLPFVETRMDWVGYTLESDGTLNYTSASGVDFTVEPELYPACPAVCPYVNYDSDPGPSELIYGLCPTSGEFDVATEAVPGAQSCQFYDQYPRSGADDSWPGRLRSQVLYRTDQPLNPDFDQEACSFSLMHGKITCGADSLLLKRDERQEFQAFPYPYCPDVSPVATAAGFRESYIYPPWEPPSWTGTVVLPGSRPAQVADRVAHSVSLADPAARDPAAHSVAPSGCGRYPSDWTFTASSQAFPDHLQSNPGDSWSAYVTHVWRAHYADLGPVLCDFGVERANHPRGQHHEPGAFRMPAYVMAIDPTNPPYVTLTLSDASVRVFLRDTADGPVRHEPGFLLGVFSPSGALIPDADPAAHGYQIVVPRGSAAEDGLLIRVANQYYTRTNEYHFTLHPFPR